MYFDIYLTRLRNNSVDKRQLKNEVDPNFLSKKLLFQDLEKFENYCGKVRGGTVKGVGPFSEEVCVFTNHDGNND